MGKLIISLVATLVLISVPIAVMVLPDTVDLENERRKANAFPTMSKKARVKEIRQWFKGVDAYFADHFPMRNSLVGFALAIHEDSYSSIDMNACIRGKDDWLFLGNSGAKCIDKLQGSISMTDSAVAKQTESFQHRAATAKELGADFFIFVGPNKSSIYPEFLPPVIVPSEKRFLGPLVDSLAANQINIFDPTDHIHKGKNLGLLYYRTDTHWNDLGAFLAYKAFLEHYDLPALPPPNVTKVNPFMGDLVNMGGYKKFPLSPGDNYALSWDNGPSVEWVKDHAKNPDATTDKIVWVFGDSFSAALRQFIAASFREVHFFTHDDFATMTQSDLPKPGIVLWIIVERNFARS